MKIKKKTSFSEEIIKNFTKKYNVKYVGTFCIKDDEDNWRNSPSAIFYSERPAFSKGHSHYVALSYKYITDEDISWFITDGSDAVSEPISGVVAKDGQVVYSAFKDDFETSDDKSVFISGGKDNLTYTAGVELVNLKIWDGVIIIAKRVISYYIYDKSSYDSEFDKEPQLVITYNPFTDVAFITNSRDTKQMSIKVKEENVLDKHNLKFDSRKIVLSDFEIGMLYKAVSAFSKNICGNFIIEKYEN